MWMMTRYGFFSITCAREGLGEPLQPVDPNRLMVRARTRTHLAALKARFPALSQAELFESTSADYRYRLFVEKRLWASVVGEIVLETDYDNFKAKVGQSMPEDGAYLSALHSTWATMHRLQS